MVKALKKDAPVRGSRSAFHHDSFVQQRQIGVEGFKELMLRFEAKISRVAGIAETVC